MATPTASILKAQVFLGFGDERVCLDYTEPTTTTGFQGQVIGKELAASATDQQVNLASYVDTATLVGVRDRNNTGVKVGVGATDKFTLAANGFIAFKNGAATPPILYLDNVSTTEKAFVEITILGTSA